jgi:hypothetical protein
MSLSHQVRNPMTSQINGELMEKIILGNDIGGLSPIEKVQYVNSVCKTIGLNPVTRPIQLIKFQGKEIPYFTKDASEQLRKINKVSIHKVDTKILDGSIYVVTVYATSYDGRQDSSTGVISISGLKGDALANAMMKAETKAKRRVTLSICGLGFIDESEAESLPGAVKVKVMDEEKKTEVPLLSDDIEIDFSAFLYDIDNAQSLEELKSIYDSVKKYDFKRKPDLYKRLILAKDNRKSVLSIKEFNREIDEAEELK